MRTLRSIQPLLALALLPLFSACIIVVHDDKPRHHEVDEHLEAREHLVLVEEAHEQNHASSVEDAELGDLRKRLAILRTASEAHALAGNESCAAAIQQGLHVGEMQLEGAPEDAIEQTFEGLTMERLIECIEAAGVEWEASGCETCAERCRSLAAYYVRREAGTR